MGRLLAYALTTCVLLAAAVPTRAQDLATAIENVKRSVAKVITEGQDERGNPVQFVGTAFVISRSPSHAYFLTNCHVAGGKQSVSIVFASAVARKARVVGCDNLSDLAVIELEEGLRPNDGLNALRFADPRRIRVGDRVMTFGFAFNLAGDPSVNSGIISALNRSIPTTQDCASEADEKKRASCSVGVFGGLIQTDATINHGNSGGPLTNYSGEVVGVSTYTTSAKGPFNVFYARSVATAAPFAEMLMTQGRVPRFDLGDLPLRTVLPDPTVLMLTGGGVQVSELRPGSRAMQAGLGPGDVITHIEACRRAASGLSCYDPSNQCSVSDIGSLFNCLALVPENGPIKLHVFNLNPKCWSAPRKDTSGKDNCLLEKIAGRDVVLYPK